ncbi:hypothetical protein CMV_029142 [Castanea mollissima]|uniref:Uncharacterized protein n=1 Tax=Castanea mollissima TaxID=60419 RepID=A0A8J4V7Q0_9ROSI|nr:hypothetical protein CMV_029142 [Castanea mollissima]
MATFSIQVEKVGEEERVTSVVVCDELGVNLEDMFEVFGMESSVEEIVEMCGSMSWTSSSWISYSPSLLVSTAKASNPPKPQIEDPLLQQGDRKTPQFSFSVSFTVSSSPLSFPLRVFIASL